jgi:hypothetical protein
MTPVSAIFTKRDINRAALSHSVHSGCQGFHQFTVLITTTILWNIIKLGFLFLRLFVEVIGVGSAYVFDDFHSAAASCGLYTFQKSE